MKFKRLPLFIPGVWSYTDDLLFATLFFSALSSYIFAFSVFRSSMSFALAFDVLASVHIALLMLLVIQINKRVTR